MPAGVPMFGDLVLDPANNAGKKKIYDPKEDEGRRQLAIKVPGGASEVVVHLTRSPDAALETESFELTSRRISGTDFAAHTTHLNVGPGPFGGPGELWLCHPEADGTATAVAITVQFMNLPA